MSKEVTLKDLLQELAEQRQFDFRGYKRTTMERRFRKRMFQLNIGSYGEYAEYIRKHGDEVNGLLTTLLINVTEFFRDPAAWEILQREMLAPMVRQLKPGDSLRAWSAGCASGEEAYSIAMILTELLGSRIAEFDVKVYATDIDREALEAARRGEYAPEALRRVRPEWREKYFYGTERLRVNRELRRRVIFGQSNLAHDAPISHVNLLVCRNVLIYFDSELQKHILGRLYYALEPGGILFLGKSESQLSNSRQFRRLSARWRIFQRVMPAQVASEVLAPEQKRDEAESLRRRQQLMMETLRLGVLVLGLDDTVTENNAAMLTLYGLAPANLAGKRLQDTDIFLHTPELGTHLQSSRGSNESRRFQSRIRAGNQERVLELTVRPLVDESGERNGTLLYCDDITANEKLEATIEELESTGEELHSANEELETTNEELQSTNEELETTNEELQSTNEELETTNEELQSLNEELETTNQELEERGKELDQLNSVYAETLEQVGLPVMLVNQAGQIQFWNSAALRLFGFKSKALVDFQLEQLPLPGQLRSLIVRRHRAVLLKQQPTVARGQRIEGKRGTLDIHFSVIRDQERGSKVLIMFEARDGEPKRWLARGKGIRGAAIGNRRK
jgi:two-component system CheB/CheR fusion protein